MNVIDWWVKKVPESFDGLVSLILSTAIALSVIFLVTAMGLTGVLIVVLGFIILAGAAIIFGIISTERSRNR